jgi:steroid 5-alpha reductase family enzyme
MNDLAVLFLIGALALLILFTLTWLLQLQTKNAAIVDTIWSASFPMLAIIYFVLVNGYLPRQLLLVAAVCIWGFRLAGHLYARTMGSPEDARYTALRNEWGEKQNIIMLRFYYFQAFLALVLSLPFALILLNTTPALNYFEIIGAAIWLIAVIGESAADHQLKKFKEDPTNKGKICDHGLWYYSRHPNYFFEWLIWVAFFIMALGSEWGFIAIICPISMFYFLTKVTGIKYTEEQMLKSRGQAFVEYQKTTSSFFLLPKKLTIDKVQLTKIMTRNKN